MPALALSSLAAAAATAVLLPLYSYPPSETACWPDLTAALTASAAASPSTPWVIIANPNSGPVSDTGSLYLRCLPALRRAHAGVRVVGYVATGYGGKDAAEVRREVAEYAAWAGLAVDPVGETGGAGLALDGIFFDEAAAESGMVPTYQGYAEDVRALTWNSAAPEIVLNPGTPPAAGYYPLADLIVTFENAYSTYEYSNLPTSHRNQQAVVIYGVPGSAAVDPLLDPLVPSASASRVGAVYLTAEALPNPYGAFGAILSQFAEAVGRRNLA